MTWLPPQAFRELVEAEMAEAGRRALETLADARRLATRRAKVVAVQRGRCGGCGCDVDGDGSPGCHSCSMRRWARNRARSRATARRAA